jgi:hypothetical protein
MALAWDPPSERSQPTTVTEPCPRCGNPLTASPRGTRHACLIGGYWVIPAGVLAPYERGEGQARQARTEDERDDDALALAEHAGILLDAIKGALADDRLHAASRARLEWYAGQIGDAAKAGNTARVARLEDKLGHEKIRRQRWWDGQVLNPAAIIPGGNGQNDDGEIYDAELVDDDYQPRAITAAPAPAIDITAVLAALNYSLRPNPAGPKRCHVVLRPPVGAPAGTPRRHCQGLADNVIRGGAICDTCLDAALRAGGRR